MILHHLRSHQGTLAINGKRQGTLLVGSQVYDEDVGSLRGKDSTLIAHTIHRIARRVQCLGKTQRTTIVLRGSLTGIVERQKDAAHRQIAHTVRTLDEVLVYQSGSLLFPSCEDEFPHLRHALQRLTTVVLMGRATPERLLVQLDFLYIGLSIDHCSMGSASSQCAAGRLYHRECCWAVAVIATSTRPVNIILFISCCKGTKYIFNANPQSSENCKLALFAMNQK